MSGSLKVIFSAIPEIGIYRWDWVLDIFDIIRFAELISWINLFDTLKEAFDY